MIISRVGCGKQPLVSGELKLEDIYISASYYGENPSRSGFDSWLGTQRLTALLMNLLFDSHNNNSPQDYHKQTTYEWSNVADRMT